MKKATLDDLKTMKRGTPVVVNLKNGVCDIAIFLRANPEGTITVVDSLLHTRDDRYIENIADYSECFIFDTSDSFLIKLLTKTSN